ncbi:MAG: hypothetical protein K0B08_06150 [Bacteroidales bacterium]|nr:hypothetical protein [Bacteroidales bacterium]
MKKAFIIIILACSNLAIAVAQESDAASTAPVNSNKSLLGYWIIKDGNPIRGAYESGYLIDNQTNVIPTAQTLEFVMHHRFDNMSNGISNLYGIYGSANVRLGLNYSITDWAQIGYGTTKDHKLQDFGLKINLLKQSRNNKSPVDVTYYGNWSIDARDEVYFGEGYQFNNRFAFFNELMVTRQFCSWFTFTLGSSFTHFNQVDSLYEHDKIALHFLGRIKFSPQSAVIFNLDLPLKIDGIKEWREFKEPPKPNFGIGYEVATATHAFQIFVGSATYLVPQYNVMKNQNDFFKSTENIYIGFNITRLWSF